MQKKIVVLNGSPRPYGNTAALISSFIKGAESSHSDVIRFDIYKMDIHPCLGCCCGGNNRDWPCVQKDGMQEIYKAFVDAEVICFASPLYFCTVSGHLKTVIDRLFAIWELNPSCTCAPKECVLLMTAGSDDFAVSVFWYEHLVKRLGWKSRGKVLCGEVFHIGDIENSPKLDEAYHLGRTL